MKLYDLTEKYLALASTIESEDDFDEAVEIALRGIVGEIKDNIDGLCQLIANSQATEEACKSEANRLLNRARVHANLAMRLKRYIQDQMTVIGQKKIKTDLFTVSVCKTAPSLEIYDLSAVPAIYDRITPREIDKQYVKEELKAGKEVPGCSLTVSEHIRIA